MKSKIIFALLLFSFILSCKKDSEKGSPTVPFVFKAMFSNGDSLVIKEGLNGVNSYGRAGGIIDTQGNYFEIQSTFFTQGSSKASVYLMQTFPSQPDSGEIESIFHAGSYSYGSSVLDSLKDGAEILLTDTSGKKWSSAFGAQPASSFNITEHKANDFDIFTPFITTGNFQCMLYDSLGNSMAITSGSFTGRTIVYP